MGTGVSAMGRVGSRVRVGHWEGPWGCNTSMDGAPRGTCWCPSPVHLNHAPLWAAYLPHGIVQCWRRNLPGSANSGRCLTALH